MFRSEWRGDLATQGFYEAVGFHKEDWEVMEWNIP